MDKEKKPTVCMLAFLLHSYGVERVVVCPGTRNAPLIMALSRPGAFRLDSVIDERSAAFIALGMARASGQPVAVVCTSGSAALNFAPALAEAYYSGTPLIAITADRPCWAIDQNEGQTIRQAGALDAVVRRSIDLLPDGHGAPLSYVNRLINEALHAATGSRPGPVHINVQLDVPLTTFDCPDRFDCPPQCRHIHFVEPASVCNLDGLAQRVDSRIMIAMGAYAPVDNINFKELANKGIAFVGESHTLRPGMIKAAALEGALDRLPRPDVLITFGGEMVSSRFKAWLRSLPGVYHIAVGAEDGATDVTGYVAERQQVDPRTFCRQLEQLKNIDRDYADEVAGCVSPRQIDKPVLEVLDYIAHVYNGLIFAANGSTMRYIQHIQWPESVTFAYNRGVNGIDGCTSTAIGMSMTPDSPGVLLITGDMGAAYDIGALATEGIPSSFKMLVLDNCGGDIFRNIKATAALPELERYFTTPPRLPLRQLADGYGFDYFETAGDRAVIDRFLAAASRPAILRLKLEPIKNVGLI